MDKVFQEQCILLERGTFLTFKSFKIWRTQQ